MRLIQHCNRDNPFSSSRLADADKYLQAVRVSEIIQELEIVKGCTDIFKQFKCFEAIWHFKYMMALTKEKTQSAKIYIKNHRKILKKIFCHI